MSTGREEELVSAAATYVQQENWSDAIAAFDQLMRLRPSDPRILYNRGIVHTRLGQFADARRDFQMALYYQPDYALAQQSLKEVEASLGAEVLTIPEPTQDTPVAETTSLTLTDDDMPFSFSPEHVIAQPAPDDDRSAAPSDPFAGFSWAEDNVTPTPPAEQTSAAPVDGNVATPSDPIAGFSWAEDNATPTPPAEQTPAAPVDDSYAAPSDPFAGFSWAADSTASPEPVTPAILPTPPVAEPPKNKSGSFFSLSIGKKKDATPAPDEAMPATPPPDEAAPAKAKPGFFSLSLGGKAIGGKKKAAPPPADAAFSAPTDLPASFAPAPAPPPAPLPAFTPVADIPAPRGAQPPTFKLAAPAKTVRAAEATKKITAYSLLDDAPPVTPFRFEQSPDTITLDTTPEPIAAPPPPEVPAKKNAGGGFFSMSIGKKKTPASEDSVPAKTSTPSPTAAPQAKKSAGGGFFSMSIGTKKTPAPDAAAPEVKAPPITAPANAPKQPSNLFSLGKKKPAPAASTPPPNAAPPAPTAFVLDDEE